MAPAAEVPAGMASPISAEQEQLASSWTINAAAWTQAVREQRIESRRLATDAAILQTITAATPQRVLDVGCGEGWLCRALTALGIAAVGIDASAPLIEAARHAGGEFHVLPYDALADASKNLGNFDLIVCNFALLDAELRPMLRALHALIRPMGRLVIQTVHPWSARGDGDYADGWRTETFTAFGEGFAAAMPWYFRTLQSWLTELHETGWILQNLREPLHPATAQPASLLLTLSSQPHTG